MKKKFLVLIMALCYYYNFSQVGIGTTHPDDGSILQIDSITGALVPPRMNATQMQAIPTPLDGAMIFNTTANSYYVFKNSKWSTLENSTLVINKSYSGTNNIISTGDNTYYDLPIGSSSVLVTNSDVYNVTANGTVTLKDTGNYMFSASLSINNMPSGTKKYIIALYVNGSLVGYLNRGHTSLPSQDYWGTSGNIIYPINANDIIKLKYVLNNEGTALSAAFINIGISKLN